MNIKVNGGSSKGYVHVYCGEGKGKTTAAIGLSIRACAYNKRIVFAQFLKSNSSAEVEILRSFTNITILQNPDKVGFYKTITETDKAQASELWGNYFACAKEFSHNSDMIILDEIIGAVQCGFIDENEVLEFLKNRHLNLEVVMTGRYPTSKILECADYISKIECVSHPYNSGVMAREGIEY